MRSSRTVRRRTGRTAEATRRLDIAMAPKPIRSVTAALRSDEFRAIGRVVLHAIGVGLVVGLVACAFYALLAVAERLLLEGIAGYEPLRPAGEQAFELPIARHAYSAVLIVLVPAL